VSKVSLKKRSTKFRRFRQGRRKLMRKGKSRKKRSSAPAWAKGDLGRYLSRSVVIRDNGTFNINQMGANLQNQQQYYMAWCATATDLDEWLMNAYNKAAITDVEDNSAIYVTRLFKNFALVNNSNQPVDVDMWTVVPRRGYNEPLASINGTNPTCIQDQLTESKTTSLQYYDYGHDPKMSARLMTWFRVGKKKSRRLQPGDTIKFSLMGSPKLWAKILSGIQTSGWFANDHTILKALSKTGVLIRARGTVVHNAASVSYPLSGSNLNVAQSGFNLDCKWDRQCWYKVPMPGLTTLSHPYGLYSGYDTRSNNLMLRENESRWADSTHNEYHTMA